MRTLVLAASIILLIPYAAAESVKEIAQQRVDQYFDVLRKNPPTLADFELLEGPAAAEREGVLEYEYCERQKWIPSQKDATCSSFIRERWASTPKVPSLFFVWLKKSLPLGGHPIVNSVSHLQEAGSPFAYRRVKVKLSGHTITFTMPEKNEQSPAFGLLEIETIDDKKVDSLLPSSGKKME